MSKKHVTLIVIIVLLSIILVIGGTYAFFIANVSGNENAENITIASGNFELTFTDSQGIYFEEGIRPGTRDDKTFTVENTGTVDDTYTYNYNIKLTELNVTYEKQDLVYTLQEYTDDNYDVLKPDGVDETGYINKNTVNEDGEMYLAINIERPPKGELHYYKLTIEFKSLEGINQNYNQGKTFGGKINVDDNRDAALYVPPTPFSEIIKVDNVNIFEDDYENIRYAGPNEEVNNYIWFNCDDYSFSEPTSAEDTYIKQAEAKNCEKWRIIGLFKNVAEANGSIENLVKIIRTERIGIIAWDSNKSNNWTNASLQKFLNGNYLTEDDSGTWIPDNYKDEKYKSITSSTKNMIEQVTWNIGGHNSSYSTTSQFYTAERGNKTYQSQPSIWTGYIGLMYISDYGYAADKSCWLTNLADYKDGCHNNDWLFTGTAPWTLTPFSDVSDTVFYVTITGFAAYYSNNTYITTAIHPSLYLKSDVKVINGKGTSDEPYILQQGA